MAPPLPLIAERRAPAKPSRNRGVQGRRLQGVESLPALRAAPVVRSVHIYEHIHDHHHFVFPLPPSVPAAPEPLPALRRPSIPDVAVQLGPEVEPAEAEHLAGRRRPSVPAVSVLPAGKVEPVEPAEPAQESNLPRHELESSLPLPLLLSADNSWPLTGGADCVSKSQPTQPSRSNLLQVLPDRSRQSLESRGSAASSRASSRAASEESKPRGSKEPPGKLRRARSLKSQATRQQPEDKLLTRLRVLQAESRWSDRRRDLRRYIRELPDSSKSKAKQKLVGQQVTGTLIDKTRLETQKARDTQENRDIVHHIEKEIHACSRSRHRVMRMQAALRRRLGKQSMELAGLQRDAQEVEPAGEEGSASWSLGMSL